MINYETFTELVNNFFEDGDLSRAMIECSEEEPLTSIQKHIGYCCKLIIGARVDRPEQQVKFMDTLLKRYSGPFNCKEHAYAAIEAINRACILFVAINTRIEDFADSKFEEFDRDEFDDFS